MLRARLLSDSSGEPVEFRGNRRKLRLARLPESSDDLVICCALDRTRSKHSRFTTSRFDLLFQPMEILVCFFIRRQDVDRILDCDRAELLQFAPDTNAQICRLSRQLMNQHDPLTSLFRL